MRMENHLHINSLTLRLTFNQRLWATRKWSLYYHLTIQVPFHSVFNTFVSVDQTVWCVAWIRTITSSRFFLSVITHVYRKWPFFIFGRWFCPNFQSNRLLKERKCLTSGRRPSLQNAFAQAPTEGVKTTRNNRLKFRLNDVTIQMKPFWQYFCKVVLIFLVNDESMWLNHMM